MCLDFRNFLHQLYFFLTLFLPGLSSMPVIMIRFRIFIGFHLQIWCLPPRRPQMPLSGFFNTFINMSLIHACHPVSYIYWVSFTDLVLATNETGDAIEWLATRGLLKNSQNCPVCNEPMVVGVYTGISDGKRWTCGPCHRTKTIR